ncbi:alanine--tRNA ligase-related protein [Sporosarcina siberiensis]|uniref:Alanine--tRNA ligase-related protein n=1 Tax=Sporosarcina siberiensis TaxID=1365606 RepID=A0ABW4SHN0_9BACL
MLKNRLYYEDPYQKQFRTNVIKESKDTEGNPYVVLENTAFYPTGGGQPHDTGSLNGIHVVNVEEEHGEIRHFIKESLECEDEVKGEIDWERRFDHMQQHAGQHILTAAFVELFDFPTVSFHLGRETVSIDIDVESITIEQLNAAELLANDIILEDRPIETKWISEGELIDYSLRKDVAVTDEIRLVIIPNYDTNGCGGTHPSSTGQVRMIKILHTEKQKQKVRVHFVCGERVLQQLEQKNLELTTASKLLSVPEAGVAIAIEKLLQTNHSHEKMLKESKELILAYEAKALLTTQEHGVIKAVYENRNAQELQKLARVLVTETEDVYIFLVSENERQLHFVAARGALNSISMKQVSANVFPLIDGKGGGSDAFVQGAGKNLISAIELLSVMQESLNLRTNS